MYHCLIPEDNRCALAGAIFPDTADDLLSHTGSENVGLKVLISRITDVLLENNCLKETCSISTRVDGDDVILTETTASTVALIVNELVQNSLKYAFKDRFQPDQTDNRLKIILDPVMYLMDQRHAVSGPYKG